MQRSRLFISLPLALVLVMSTTAVALGGPSGSDRPFKGSLVGYNYWLGPDDPDGNPLDCGAPFFETTFGTASGSVTHAGRVQLTQMHCPTLDVTSNGQLTIVAANGDQMYGTYTATIDYFPEDEGDYILVTITMSFDGGTGRFSDATGHADGQVMIRYDGFEDAEWPYVWVFDGSVTY